MTEDESADDLTDEVNTSEGEAGDDSIDNVVNDEKEIGVAEEMIDLEVDRRAKVNLDVPEVDEVNEMNPERRPLRGSKIKLRMRNEDTEKIAKVKNVGKKNSKQKDLCWLSNDEGTIVVDFFKDVEAWTYVEKPRVKFQVKETSEVFVVFDDQREDTGVDKKKDKSILVFVDQFDSLILM